MLIADRVADALEENQILFLVHNAHFRGVFHFFAPYLPLTVYVSRRDQAKAVELLGTELGFHSHSLPSPSNQTDHVNKA